MYVLSDFKENTGHSGILADRNLFVFGNLIIFDNVVKDTTGNLSVLTGTTGLDGFFDIIRKHLIGFDAKSLDGVRNHGCLYFTHVGCTPSCFLFYCIVSGIFVQGWMKEFAGSGTDSSRKKGRRSGDTLRFLCPPVRLWMSNFVNSITLKQNKITHRWHSRPLGSLAESPDHLPFFL